MLGHSDTGREIELVTLHKEDVERMHCSSSASQVQVKLRILHR